MEDETMNFESATRSVLRVGDGRGFIVDGAHDRFVITAAHCLPFLPPPMSFSSLEERTFLKLLAQLGCSPDVWAECFFVDPVSDLAIFGPPDSQELSEQFEAYEALLSEMETIKIRAAESRGKVWLLSLSNEWHACTAQHWGGALWYFDVVDGIHGGMSGSPALRAPEELLEWSVLLTAVPARFTPQGGPNANLALHLPGWLLNTAL